MAEAKPAAELVEVSVDGRKVEVASGSLVWDACENAGIYVPVYCAHKKMEPVAVCRMCLVEVEGMPKLQPACSTRVAPQHGGADRHRAGARSSARAIWSFSS